MRDRILGLVLVTGLMVAASATAAFEPLFQVTGIKGTVTVKKPKQADFSPAEEGKAYPYGTEVMTGRRAGASLVLSGDSSCTLKGGTCVDLSEGKGKAGKKTKTLTLKTGEVDVDVAPGYDKNGDKLNVKTASAICKAGGGKLNVRSKMQGRFRSILISVKEGTASVNGEHFDIKKLVSGDQVSLLGPLDRSFLRLKDLSGDYEITILDENRNPKVIAAVEGTVLKIWQRKVPETGEIVVTTFIVKDGTVDESVTVTRDGKTDSGEWEGEIPEKTDDDKLVDPASSPELKSKPIDTKPPTTTTTTTTVPSPTPVGRI